MDKKEINLNFFNKGFLIVFFLTCVYRINLAQSDTLFAADKSLPCKIIEITETEIKYQLISSIDGPIFVTNKKNIVKYKLRNGFEENVVLDTIPDRILPKEIVGNRFAIKTFPANLMFACISIGFEKVLVKGTNLEVETGFNNNSFHSNPTLKSFGTYSDIGAPFGYCIYLKPGIKILLGKEFSSKRIKYTHPLKGRYIRFDIGVSYVQLKGLFRFNGYEYYGSPAPKKIVTNVSSIAYGGFICYGRQFLISKLFTCDYSFGLGYTLQNNHYSNPDFVFHDPRGMDYDDRARSISRYGGFTRDQYFGYSVTASLKIGYIIPSKKPVNRGNTTVQVK